MQLIIINATCEFFSIREIVAEDKAVKRLTQIKNLFNSLTQPKKVKRRFEKSYHKQTGKQGYLKVTTEVFNKKMF